MTQNLPDKHELLSICLFSLSIVDKNLICRVDKLEKKVKSSKAVRKTSRSVRQEFQTTDYLLADRTDLCRPNFFLRPQAARPCWLGWQQGPV